jgi:putative copper export protein
VLAPDLDTVRIFLHVLGASIWVGGQIVLVGLLPVLRGAGGTVARDAARAWNKVAWGAFALLLVTGVWNLFEVSLGDRPTSYQVTVFVKLLVVALAGGAAAVHALTPSKQVLAISGAVGGLASLAAVFLGVLLRG